MPSRTEPDARGKATESVPTSGSDDVPFESSLDELAGLVGRLESGALGLTESIAAYERGVALLRRLHAQLSDAEERVRLLVRIDEQGRPILAADVAGPAGGADSPGDSAAGRAGKTGARPGRGRRLPGMDDTVDAG